MTKYIFIILVLFCFSMPLLHAQDLNLTPIARFETMNVTPRLGEPLDMVISVTTLPDYTVTFPDFNTDWGTISVIEAQSPVIDKNDIMWIHSVQLKVVVWRTGDLTTPATYINYLAPDALEPIQLVVQPVFFIVPSLLGENPVLIESRKVTNISYLPIYWVVIGIGVVALGVGLFIVSVIRLRTHPDLVVFTPNPKTVTERTLQSLKRLRFDAPNIASLYGAVGDHLRVYLVSRLNLDDPDWTTAELIDWMTQNKALPTPRLHELQYLLEQSDIAKFAPKIVLAEADPEFAELAHRWVSSVDNQLTIAVENVP